MFVHSRTLQKIRINNRGIILQFICDELEEWKTARGKIYTILYFYLLSTIARIKNTITYNIHDNLIYE